MNFDLDNHHRQIYFPNRQSIRLKEYDYSQPGIFFVTICTQNRDCLFGKIVDGEIRLNNIGKLVYMWWNNISQKYQNVELDNHAIMPNHLHGIIIINDDYCRGEVTRPYSNLQ